MLEGKSLHYKDASTKKPSLTEDTNLRNHSVTMANNGILSCLATYDLIPNPIRWHPLFLPRFSLQSTEMKNMVHFINRDPKVHSSAIYQNISSTKRLFFFLSPLKHLSL